MNAQELFLKDGISAHVWYCSECKRVDNKNHAEECCKKKICKCGQEIEESYYLLCKPCRRIEDLKKEDERFQNAEKVTSWDGPVYLDGYWNEGYAANINDLMDYLRDGEEAPKYVWTCHSIPVYNLDLDDILEREEMDHIWEYFDRSFDTKGINDLKKAIDKFNDQNKNLVYWEVNYKKALLL